jgi:transposase-like protein
MPKPRSVHRHLSVAFDPPHCPNSTCAFYSPRPDWNVVRDGAFRRPSDGQLFPRFRCRHCGRRFSSRTFEVDYWLKLRHLFLAVVRLSPEGPGLRQIARLLGISHTTVLRHVARAGRQSLLFHEQMLRGCPVSDAIVVDGFESFEFSQYYPFDANLAVEARSWLIRHFTDSPLRRKGAMRPDQRRRRSLLEERFGRPDPKAVENGILELIRSLTRRLSQGELPELVIRSDDHPAYQRAIRRFRRLPGMPAVRHEITPSTLRRTTRNPLFPVNLADLLLRHGQANHRRETIAFSKRRQGALERLAVFVVWRNAIKSRREKVPGETAAMAAGILPRPLEWEEVFARRQFPRRENLPGSWWSYYWGRVRTAVMGARQREHRLKYAF